MDRKSGFTIPEMLAVIAIVMILIAMLLPSLGKARQRAEGAVCMSNMHQLAMSHKLYANDSNQIYCHRESFLKDPPGWVGTGPWPYITGIPDESILVTKRYLDGTGHFMCPSDDGYREDREDILPYWYRYIRPANFSYTRNAEVDSRNPRPNGYRIKRPSDTCLTAEESELAPMNGSEFYANPWDVMTTRHSGQAAMNFFDMHAEYIDGQEFNDAPVALRVQFWLDPK